MKNLLNVCSCMLAVLVCSMTVAQPYPVKPVRIIVTFPPGGPTDIVGRSLAQKFTEAFKQQFVVDNRGGPSRARRRGPMQLPSARSRQPT